MHSHYKNKLFLITSKLFPTKKKNVKNFLQKNGWLLFLILIMICTNFNKIKLKIKKLLNKNQIYF